MAKKQDELKRHLTVVHTFRPVSPIPTFTALYTPTCGCGRIAEYLVYEDALPHCNSCFCEAVDSKVPVLVRKIGGGYDDAS